MAAILSRPLSRLLLAHKSNLVRRVKIDLYRQGPMNNRTPEDSVLGL